MLIREQLHLFLDDLFALYSISLRLSVFGTTTMQLPLPLLLVIEEQHNTRAYNIFIENLRSTDEIQ